MFLSDEKFMLESANLIIQGLKYSAFHRLFVIGDLILKISG